MRFDMPNFPCSFEIDDAWLAEVGFSRSRDVAYKTVGCELVALAAVEPPPRTRTVPKDGHGFDKARLLHVMARMIARQNIDPVPVFELSNRYAMPVPYRFQVRDGFHRFYASVAMGYSHLPVDME